jgi:hypothetical protein
MVMSCEPPAAPRACARATANWPRQGAVVFESTIALTTVNGVPNATGGATQTIVVDRNQFTPPVKTGTIVVKKEG